MTPEQHRQVLTQLREDYPDQKIHIEDMDPGNPDSAVIVHVGDPPPMLDILGGAARIARVAKRLARQDESQASEDA